MSELLFTADIYDKFVKVKRDAVERNISHNDFLQTLANKLGLLSKLANKEEEFAGSYVLTLPESFVYEANVSATKKVLYLYHKEASLPIYLDLREGYQLHKMTNVDQKQLLEAFHKANISHEGDMLLFKTMRMPNIVCSISLEKKGVKKDNVEKWTVGTVRYNFTESPRAMLKIAKNGSALKDLIPCLGWLPFPNTYEDGRICYGSNTTIVNIEQEKFKDLEQYMHFITAIPYNFHVQGGRNLSGPAGRIPKEESISAFMEKEGIADFANIYSRKYSKGSYDILNWFFYLNSQTSFPYKFFK
ncbi:MAG TPA: hypothetical protein VFM18_09840 [Methanosarcina sp.]|nr:hypothetical protein [Methanosarcina sp.]